MKYLYEELHERTHYLKNIGEMIVLREHMNIDVHKTYYIAYTKD